MDRMQELVDLLNQASEAYYQQDKEIMSNLIYDSLYDELVSLEKAENRVLPDSPTRKVGYEVVSSLVKVRHSVPMLSLDKTKELTKLKSFLEEHKGILSWKLDGLTIVLTYRDGKLSQAVTRGNGLVGEDVTHNARYFVNLPKSISFKGELILRGEAVISYSDFESINSKLAAEEQYKNPRNLCSGSVRQLNSEVSANRKIRLYPFSLVKADGNDFGDKKSNMLKWLSELGFECVEYKQVDQDNIEDTVKYFQGNITGNDLASDGLVLTYDDVAYSESLGATSKFPRDSIAFKWADEIRESKLVEVIWNTSRTGLINPVAVFEPVELEGTQVNRASLHNVSIFEGLQLGKGDSITVYKANMIIPQVAENLTRSNTENPPEYCPVCGSQTKLTQQNGVKCLYCLNLGCKAQLIRSLTHFAGRDAMDIEAISEATIEKFVKAGYLKQYTDIFELEKYKEEIKNMEGFGEKSVNNLMASIERAKDMELPNFIYALGIPQVGLSNAKLLCAYFNYDLDRIIKASAEELEEIKGYGESISGSIYNYFSNEENLKALEYVRSLLRFKKPEMPEEAGVLKGLTFVITGDLVRFKNRKELQEIIEKSGGKVAGSVSSKTAFLINNDNESASSKNKKAKELGVPVITEEDFLERFKSQSQ